MNCFNSVCTFDHSRGKTLHPDAACCLQRSSTQSVSLQHLVGRTHGEEPLRICKTLQITPLKHGNKKTTVVMRTEDSHRTTLFHEAVLYTAVFP